MSSNVAVSSRVRMARNSSDVPFPIRMTETQRVQLWQKVCAALSDGYQALSVGKTTGTEATALTEQHWISAALLSAPGTRGVLYNKDTGVSVMVNEEDHLRLQTIKPGLSLNDTLNECQQTEQTLSKSLNFAFDDNLGYLTACPSNLGTALRASVMLHLPSLTESGHLKPILEAIAKLGVTARGFYGEGTQATGAYYQLSNQVSLGMTESDIITQLTDIVTSIIAKENAARTARRDNSQLTWDDRVYRAYGTLTNAKLISFEEALTQLSILRMGVLENLFPTLTADAIDTLTAQIGPATLNHKSGQTLPPQQRDAYRAELIQQTVNI